MVSAASVEGLLAVQLYLLLSTLRLPREVECQRQPTQSDLKLGSSPKQISTPTRPKALPYLAKYDLLLFMMVLS